MDLEISTATKTKWAVAAVVALALIGIAAPLAFADSIGAPTSAAGGVSAPSSPSRPGAVGPLSGTSGSTTNGGAVGPLRDDGDSMILQLQPGTGKFEGPHNGTTTPCIGTTGFGSSNVVPGHKC
jgi:hypothetical protein